MPLPRWLNLARKNLFLWVLSTAKARMNEWHPVGTASARVACMVALCLFVVGCVHKPFRPGDKTVLDAALCALSDLDPAADGPVLGPEVKYMFCVPDTVMLRAEVARIDPTLSFFAGARGKRVCGERNVLCVGSTRQKGFKTVLNRLAKRPYIEEITLAPLEFY